MSTIRRSTGLLAVTGVGATALVACGSFGDAGTGPRTNTSAAGIAAAEQALGTIVRHAGERVMTADTVAAAKWGTTQPIDDPTREKAILDSTAPQATKLGIDQAAARRIFGDQITANKTVQRALHAKWQAQPAEQPTHHPDLTTQVRPTLDRINSQLLTAIQQAQPRLTGLDPGFWTPERLGS